MVQDNQSVFMAAALLFDDISHEGVFKLVTDAGFGGYAFMPMAEGLVLS